jgi:hypothetical protein
MNWRHHLSSSMHVRWNVYIILHRNFGFYSIKVDGMGIILDAHSHRYVQKVPRNGFYTDWQYVCVLLRWHVIFACACVFCMCMDFFTCASVYLHAHMLVCTHTCLFECASVLYMFTCYFTWSRVTLHVHVLLYMFTWYFTCARDLCVS